MGFPRTACGAQGGPSALESPFESVPAKVFGRNSKKLCAYTTYTG